MMQYVLDSNFFIQAHRVYYPMDVVPSFWERLKELAEIGSVISIDKVKEEIYGNKDQLKYWCSDNLPKGFFKNSVEAIVQYKEVVRWAASKSSHYKQSAIDEFLQAEEADAFLIAYVLADSKNRIIVTQEKGDNSTKKVKIPDVCLHFNLRYINTVKMMRELGLEFEVIKYILLQRNGIP
jgi:hypothetical protein